MTSSLRGLLPRRAAAGRSEAVLQDAAPARAGEREDEVGTDGLDAEEPEDELADEEPEGADEADDGLDDELDGEDTDDADDDEPEDELDDDDELEDDDEADDDEPEDEDEDEDDGDEDDDDGDEDDEDDEDDEEPAAVDTPRPAPRRRSGDAAPRRSSPATRAVARPMSGRRPAERSAPVPAPVRGSGRRAEPARPADPRGAPAARTATGTGTANRRWGIARIASRDHVDLLVLLALERGAGSGRDVITRLRADSGDLLDAPEQTVHRTLHRLARNRLVVRRTDGSGRITYSLSETGRRSMLSRVREWRALSRAFGAILTERSL